MNQKIFQRLAFIQNQNHICLHEKCKNMKDVNSFFWKDISRFIHFYDEPVFCSICLIEPLLPRMDRCGHIFCFLCLIRLINYNNTENPNAILCPICKDVIIDLQSLKRVELVKNNSALKNGNYIKFKLLLKMKNDFSPRNADDLYQCKERNVPLFGSELGHCLGVSLDSNETVKWKIENDLNTVKDMELSTNLCSKYIITSGELNEIQSLLTEELRTLSSQEFDYSSQYHNDGKSFNLLEFHENNDQRVLFYQCCANDRFVFLDEDQQEFIFNQAIIGFKKHPPISVQGTVIDHKEQTVDRKFISKSGLNHLTVGIKINFVKIDLETASLSSDICKSKWKALKVNQKILIKEREELSEQLRKIALRASERKNLPRRPRNLLGKEFDFNSRGIIRPRTLNQIPTSFNLCTLGLDCSQSDEDYPHDETCRFFKALSPPPPPVPQNVSYQSSQSSAVRQEEKENYFGLQRRKLNVFYPPQDKSNSIDKEDCTEKSLPVRRDVVNFPPEPRRNILLAMAENNNRNSSLTQYMVEKKKGTQRQHKKLRKSKKA